MPQSRTALVTGANGGIGQALVIAFRAADYRVIATDLRETGDAPGCDVFVPLDLARLVSDPDYAAASLQQLRAAIGTGGLAALINNAALQIVAPIEQLSAQDWTHTLQVNTIAPFLLTQGLLAKLEYAGGAVVNISSIHASLTKAGFSAYASSKAALSGLSRAMAVELGARVRVNAITPAAIGTDMLRDGFAGQPEALAALDAVHPLGRIGAPEEVAATAVFLCSEQAQFITGAEFPVHGGIGARLHDPL